MQEIVVPGFKIPMGINRIEKDHFVKIPDFLYSINALLIP
jgi:hypothetical protein